MAQPRVKLILDSGAFSAWKRKLRIEIKDYIRYAAAHEHLLYQVVNLDVIPGEMGRGSSQAEVDEAAKASHANLRAMQKAGLNPMPVFHFGEDFQWLHRLLDAGEPYIGIGGLVSKPAPEQRAFLDRVFSILTNKDGQPVVKTHGFGVASFDLLRRYPWSTCDATSWALGAAFGSIFVPSFKVDKPDYSQPPVKMTISEVERKNMPADHYLRFGPAARKRVEDFLRDEVQIDLKAASAKDGYEERARAIVFSMLNFQDQIGAAPFRHRAYGLLTGGDPASALDPIAHRGVKLVFATWTNAEYQGRILTEEDARYRLASYWELRELPSGLLEEYVTRGKAGKRKKEKEVSIPETE